MSLSKHIDPRKADKDEKPPFPPQKQKSPGSEKEMTPAPDFGEESYIGTDRLRGQVALITGADSGIGRAVALAFAREGADVTLAYLKEHEDAKRSVQAVQDTGAKALSIAGDISSDSFCKNLIEATVEKFGHLDILVNNAAYQGEAVERFEDLTPERIEKTFRTNIVAMFFLVRHALKYLRAGGSIINVASIQAYQPSPAILDYASTKGAIVTFTKGLSQELIQRGIRVNCVAPGPVWTPLIVQSFDTEKVSSFAKDAPLKRPAQPVEVAPAFVFLASNDARYITGEVLGVTGGKLLA